MLFNLQKKTKVKYFIVDDEQNKWHTALYQPVEPAVKNLVGCPAMSSVTNRIFNVKPTITMDVTFGHDGTEPYFNYQFDTKEFEDTSYNYQSIEAMVGTSVHSNVTTLQYNLSIAFYSDDKDLEIMLVGKDGKNCTFAAGAFNIHSWIRQLNASWYLNDNNKEAKVSIDYDSPIMQIVFNKPVELEEVPYEGKAAEYHKHMKYINNYKKNIVKIYDNIKRKRAKKLI